MSGAQLSALDAAFVAVERAGTPLHIGCVAFVEEGPLLDGGGRLRLDDIRALLEARLSQVPELRHRIDGAGHLVGRPRWVDDEHFAIDRHVRAVELPGGAGEDEVRRTAGALFAEPLDLSHPPWCIDLLTGVAGGRIAVVERIHHALVDGVSGVDVALALFDVDPAGRPELPPPGPEPASHPETRTHGFRPLAGARRAASVWAGLVEAAGSGTAPPSSLNVASGPARETTWVRASLPAVKSAARSAGARVNDVVLAAVTGGLRELLLTRGEFLGSDAIVRALVPVSVRPDDQRGALGNQVSALLVDLPVGLGDPAAQLAAVRDRAERAKASGEVEASETLVGLAGLLPAVGLRLVRPLLRRQPLVNLVVTNVPGPPVPLYVMGARVLEVFPYVPLAGNLSLGVAVLSYAGALGLGITTDPLACPDAAVFAAGLDATLQRLGGAWRHRDGS